MNQPIDNAINIEERKEEAEREKDSVPWKVTEEARSGYDYIITKEQLKERKNNLKKTMLKSKRLKDNEQKLYIFKVVNDVNNLIEDLKSQVKIINQTSEKKTTLRKLYETTKKPDDLIYNMLSKRFSAKVIEQNVLSFKKTRLTEELSLTLSFDTSLSYFSDDNLFCKLMLYRSISKEKHAIRKELGNNLVAYDFRQSPLSIAKIKAMEFNGERQRLSDNESIFLKSISTYDCDQNTFISSMPINKNEKQELFIFTDEGKDYIALTSRTVSFVKLFIDELSDNIQISNGRIELTSKGIENYKKKEIFTMKKSKITVKSYVNEGKVLNWESKNIEKKDNTTRIFYFNCKPNFITATEAVISSQEDAIIPIEFEGKLRFKLRIPVGAYDTFYAKRPMNKENIESGIERLSVAQSKLIDEKTELEMINPTNINFIFTAFLLSKQELTEKDVELIGKLIELKPYFTFFGLAYKAFLALGKQIEQWRLHVSDKKALHAMKLIEACYNFYVYSRYINRSEFVKTAVAECSKVYTLLRMEKSIRFMKLFTEAAFGDLVPSFIVFTNEFAQSNKKEDSIELIQYLSFAYDSVERSPLITTNISSENLTSTRQLIADEIQTIIHTSYPFSSAVLEKYKDLDAQKKNRLINALEKEKKAVEKKLSTLKNENTELNQNINQYTADILKAHRSSIAKDVNTCASEIADLFNDIQLVKQSEEFALIGDNLSFKGRNVLSAFEEGMNAGQQKEQARMDDENKNNSEDYGNTKTKREANLNKKRFRTKKTTQQKKQTKDFLEFAKSPANPKNWDYQKDVKEFEKELRQANIENREGDPAFQKLARKWYNENKPQAKDYRQKSGEQSEQENYSFPAEEQTSDYFLGNEEY